MFGGQGRRQPGLVMCYADGSQIKGNKRDMSMKAGLKEMSDVLAADQVTEITERRDSLDDKDFIIEENSNVDASQISSFQKELLSDFIDHSLISEESSQMWKNVGPVDKTAREMSAEEKAIEEDREGIFLNLIEHVP